MKKAIFVSVLLVLLANTISCTAKEATNNKRASFDFIRTGFLNGYHTISTFKEDIEIQLEGSYTKEDSVHLAELITELKGTIQTVDIRWVARNGNLKLSLAPLGTELNYLDEGINGEFRFKLSSVDGAARSVHARLHFEEFVVQQRRNQAIQYVLVRSLVPLGRFYHNKVDEIEGINPKGIFSQSDFRDVSFSQFDKELIEILYVSNFYVNFFKYYPLEYLRYARKVTFHRNYSSAFYILPSKNYFLSRMALLLVVLYGLLILKFWKFKAGSRKWSKNILNSIVLAFPLVILALASIGNLNSDADLNFPVLLSFIAFLSIALIAILAASVNFILELVFTRASMSPPFKYILQFLFPFLSGLIALYFFIHFYENTSSLRDFIIIYIFVISAIRSVLNFLSDKSYYEIREKELQLLKMEELKSRAELQAIQSRVNPHFLYNSLNSIASLAISNPEKTRKMALSLSEFCRFALNKTNSDTILVKDEVQMVSAYLQIEKVRFGEKLNFSLEVDERANNVGIPRFIIQPLIENAIKHGASQMTSTCEIQLQIKLKNEGVSIIVSDNGPSFPDFPVYGYGLQSIFDKLEILFEGKSKIDWVNKPNKRIRIWLPISNNFQ